MVFDPRESALLNFRALRGLPSEQKCLGVLAFTAEFKRAKVLVPFAFGGIIGSALAPELEAIEVLGRNFSLTSSLQQMVPESDGQIIPLDFGHLLPEDHAGKLVLSLVNLLRVLGGLEEFSDHEETGLFCLFGG